MGLIRKTLSVSTLGVIPFRSKKEKLRRAERATRDAESELERERSARAHAESRISEAENRVKKAQLAALHAAKQFEKNRQKGRGAKKSRRMAEMFTAAEPFVREGVESARQASTDAMVRGRKAAKQARKATKQASRDAKHRAEKSVTKAKQAAESAQAAIAPHAEHAMTRASELVDQVTSSS